MHLRVIVLIVDLRGIFKAELLAIPFLMDHRNLLLDSKQFPILVYLVDRIHSFGLDMGCAADKGMMGLETWQVNVQVLGPAFKTPTQKLCTFTLALTF